MPLTKSKFLSGPGKAPATKFSAKVSAREGSHYLKIGAYAKTGCGKSDAIVHLLLRNLRVFVVSTDIGGSGLLTVRSHLALLGRTDLLQNLVEYEIVDRDCAYQEMESFIDLWKDASLAPHFEVTLADGSTTTLFAWDPDVLVWEGFSNFQDSAVIRYVLTMNKVADRVNAKGEVTSTGTESEMREAGFRADDWRDWDAIKRATDYILDEFLIIENPVTRKKIHKYVTFHERDAETGEGISGETKVVKEEDKQPGLLLSGAARNVVRGGFDLILRMTREEERKSGAEKLSALNQAKTAPKMKYYYTLSGPDTATKMRGYYDLPERMEADFGKVWDTVLGTKEPPK